MKLPCYCQYQSFVLESYNILSAGAFLALLDGKFYTLTFIKGFEAFCNNRIEVNKNVSTRIALDKAVAFTAIEPFYSTLFSRHDLELLSF